MYVKRVAHIVTHRNFSPDSAVPLSYMEPLSIFRFIVLVFTAHSFNVLIHSHRSHQINPLYYVHSAKQWTASWRT